MWTPSPVLYQRNAELTLWAFSHSSETACLSLPLYCRTSSFHGYLILTPPFRQEIQVHSFTYTKQDQKCRGTRRFKGLAWDGRLETSAIDDWRHWIIIIGLSCIWDWIIWAIASNISYGLEFVISVGNVLIEWAVLTVSDHAYSYRELSWRKPSVAG